MLMLEMPTCMIPAVIPETCSNCPCRFSADFHFVQNINPISCTWLQFSIIASERQALRSRCNRDHHSHHTRSDNQKRMLGCTQASMQMLLGAFHGIMQPRWPAVDDAARNRGAHSVHTHVPGRCCHCLEGPCLICAQHMYNMHHHGGVYVD